MAGLNNEAVFEAIKTLTEKVENLTEELEKHRKSSEKHSRRLLWLTWALVVLTIVLILQGFGGFELILQVL